MLNQPAVWLWPTCCWNDHSSSCWNQFLSVRLGAKGWNSQRDVKGNKQKDYYLPYEKFIASIKETDSLETFSLGCARKQKQIHAKSVLDAFWFFFGWRCGDFNASGGSWWKKKICQVRQLDKRNIAAEPWRERIHWLASARYGEDKRAKASDAATSKALIGSPVFCQGLQQHFLVCLERRRRHFCRGQTRKSNYFFVPGVNQQKSEQKSQQLRKSLPLSDPSECRDC